MATKRATVSKVKASQLKPPRHGARPSESELQDVQASFARHGQLQPIIARPDGEVIVGDQRRRSLPGDATVEVVFLDVDEVAALEMRLSEEYAKTEQSPAERADMVAALANLLAKAGEQPTAKALAERIGSTPRTVERYLRLAALPTPIKTMLTKGDVSYREAEALSQSSSLESTEKVGLARKFASGAAPGGNRARDVVRFVEHAPRTVRKRFTSDSRSTYDQAERAARRHQTQEYRQWLEEQTAKRASAFFVTVTKKVQGWVPAVADIEALAGLVPDAQKAGLVAALRGLRDVCDKAITAVTDAPRDEAPVPTPQALDRVARRIDAAADALVEPI